MPTNPLVSIITPSYNKGEFIEETIQSVHSQSYGNIEHIIIDGNSTDNTISILKRYPHLIWISEPDDGQTDAINKGLTIAKGDILAYLNADDTYLPDAIETVVAAALKYPHNLLLYGDIVHIDKNSKIIAIRKTGVVNIERLISFLFYLPQPAVFFRREVITRAGLFDESYHLTMDYDYWLRTFPRYPSHYINKPLAAARFYEETKSTALNYKFINERVRALDSFYKNRELSEKYGEIKRKAYSVAYLVGAHDYFRLKNWNSGWYHLKQSIRIYPPIMISGIFFSTASGTLLRLSGILKGCQIPR